MIPSVYTNEIAVKARMEDRVCEAEQYRRALRAGAARASEPEIQRSDTRLFGWLRRLATSFVGGR